MAIHLILLAVNEVNKDLTGHVHIYSDCLGALNMIKNLPPSRIPTRSPHSDVLKNILVNSKNLFIQPILLTRIGTPGRPKQLHLTIPPGAAQLRNGQPGQAGLMGPASD
jgi:hypothetical protein